MSPFRLSLVLTLLLAFRQNLKAQEVPVPYIDTVTAFIAHQVVSYPQEKIHLHIDKPNYLAGEKIWFRAYLVDALLHKQANASRYVYAELVDPLDKVVCRVKISPDAKGYFHGHLPLYEGLPEGNYTLRAYTMYMKNLGEEYFYRKTIPVIDPLSTSFEIQMNYEPDERRSTATFRFIEMYTRKPFITEDLTVRLKGQEEQKLKFGNDSTASFTFRNPAKGEPRVFTVKMNYMGKIYTKYLYMPSEGDNYDITFHAEGGNLLAGVENTVAFKAIDANGLSKELNGNIVDGSGNVITEFGTEHLGMGSFTISPEKGQKYYAVFTNEQGVEKRFELPESLENYVGLHLRQSEDELCVSVNRTPDFNTDNQVYLIVLARGYPIYSEEWDFAFEETLFDKQTLPSGLYQLVLVDDKKNILSERLFFNYLFGHEPEAVLTTAKDNYAAREKIQSTVKFRDGNGVPLSGNFSIAVTDDKDITPDSSSSIISTLYLTSELNGYIENPAYYLTQGDEQAVAGLDLLMMTQGWRRYALSEAIRGNPVFATIEPETTQIIRGKVLGTVTSTGKDAVISMLAISDEISDVRVAHADGNGRFEFRDFEYPDSTRYILQARSRNDKGNVLLEVENDEKSRYPAILSRLPGYNPDYGQISEDYILKADQKYMYEHGMRIVNIEEISVTGKRGGESKSQYYSAISSSSIITSEEIENSHLSNMSALMIRLGLWVSGGTVQLRGKVPLTVIDDVPYEDYDILSLDIQDIDEVFVIRDASALIFGNRGANGAIVVSTKRGYVAGNVVSKNISELVEPLGFQRPLEFYSPKYDAANTNDVPDLRTTIYWKPDVTIEQDGEVTLDFYSADAPTTYSVVIEGITDDGRPVRKVGKIERNR